MSSAQTSSAATLHPRHERFPWRAEAGLALICLIWGATFVLVKSALDDISTLLFLGLRFGVAFIALAVLFAVKRGWRAALRPGPVVGGLLAGCCLFAGYLLQTQGLKYTTPGKSGFITGLYIVLVPLLAGLVYRRAPQLPEVLGVALATVGMGLMTISGDTLRMNLGDALTVGCAFMYAAHILVLGRFSPTMTVERLTLLQIGTCAVLGLALVPLFEQPYLRPSTTVWTAIAVTGLLATALAFTIQTWAQRFTTPTRTAVIFSLEPVFALGTSWVADAEVIGARALAGAACILAGILVVELKPRKDAAHPGS